MNAADQYLKAIYLIQETENGPAATGAIADALDVSPASANEMIGKLADDGLADHEKYKGVSLTDDGIGRARDVLERYCIIERFLATTLEVEDYRGEATQIQAVVDQVVADRVDLIVDRQPDCPDCFLPDEDRCEYLEIPAEGGPAA